MTQTRTAKLFKNGASQAVRLPADFRFPGNEVYASLDPESGEVTLSAHPGTKVWADFFDLVHSINSPDEFMAERPMNTLSAPRDLFAEEN